MNPAPPNLLWINGSINAGKSTTARLLHQAIGQSINIELDAFSGFASQIAVDEKLEFVIEDALQIASHWQQRGYLPIVNGPVYGNELKFMREQCKKLDLVPFMITLSPPKEVAKQDRGARKLTDWERSRIDYHYEDCQITQQGFGYLFDNAQLSLEESVAKLLVLVQRVFKS